MSEMSRRDAAMAVWRCTVQGFITIRSATYYGVEANLAAAVGVASGFAGAKPYISEVASTALAIRRARAAGLSNAEAMQHGWSTAGQVGRNWLADTVREYAGHQAYVGLMAVAGNDAAPKALGRPRQGLSRRANWCREMHMAGFSDIRDLAIDLGQEPPEPESLSQIRNIADACHRIPYPDEIPAILRPWLVLSYLDDRFGSMSPKGLQWCHERSAGLGKRIPPAIEIRLRPV